MCLLTNIVVGNNDYLFLALAVFVAYLTQSVIIEFQMGSRFLIADHFNKDSEISQALRKPGILAIILSSLAAFFLAVSFLSFAKGLIIKHGFIALTLILFLISVFLYNVFSDSHESNANEDKSVENTIKKHLARDTSYFANFAFKILIISIAINLIFALLFSAFDTANFISSNVLLANFDEHAVKQGIAFSEHNSFSRALINAYLLMDSFKLALVNQLLDVFYKTEDKMGSFYLFYFLIFLLNIIKLIPFSVGFIFLLKGVRIRSAKYQHYAELASEKAILYTDKTLKNYQKNRSEKGDS